MAEFRIAPGREAQINAANAHLVSILQAAAANAPPNISVVEAFSGKSARSTGTTNHPSGRAVDVNLYDASGRKLDNYLGNPFGAKSASDLQDFKTFEQFAQVARQTQQQMYPDLSSAFRWGGYFQGGVNPVDLMHFDISGDRIGPQTALWQNGLQVGALAGVSQGAHALGDVQVASAAPSVPMPSLRPEMAAQSVAATGITQPSPIQTAAATGLTIPSPQSIAPVMQVNLQTELQPEDLSLGAAPPARQSVQALEPIDLPPNAPARADAIVRAAMANDPAALNKAMLQTITMAMLDPTGKTKDAVTAYLGSIPDVAPGAARIAQGNYAANAALRDAVPSTVRGAVDQAFAANPLPPRATAEMPVPQPRPAMGDAVPFQNASLVSPLAAGPAPQAAGTPLAGYEPPITPRASGTPLAGYEPGLTPQAAGTPLAGYDPRQIGTPSSMSLADFGQRFDPQTVGSPSSMTPEQFASQFDPQTAGSPSNMTPAQFAQQFDPRGTSAPGHGPSVQPQSYPTGNSPISPELGITQYTPQDSAPVFPPGVSLPDYPNPFNGPAGTPTSGYEPQTYTPPSSINRSWGADTVFGGAVRPEASLPRYTAPVGNAAGPPGYVPSINAAVPGVGDALNPNAYSALTHGSSPLTMSALLAANGLMVPGVTPPIQPTMRPQAPALSPPQIAARQQVARQPIATIRQASPVQQQSVLSRLGSLFGGAGVPSVAQQILGQTYGSNAFSAYTPTAAHSANYNSVSGGSPYDYTTGTVNGQPGGSYTTNSGSNISYWTDSQGNDWTTYG